MQIDREGDLIPLSFDMESSGFAGRLFGGSDGEEIKRCEKSSKPRPSLFFCFIGAVLFYACGTLQPALYKHLILQESFVFD